MLHVCLFYTTDQDTLCYFGFFSKFLKTKIKIYRDLPSPGEHQLDTFYAQNYSIVLFHFTIDLFSSIFFTNCPN